VPILFTLECLGDGGIAMNIKAIICLALMTCDGLFQDYIVKHLVYLGDDSAFKFQGVKFKIIFNENGASTLTPYPLYDI
jgi:hypothetical protein